MHGLPPRVRLSNASGTTHSGEPYIRVFLTDGVLQPGHQLTQRLLFSATGRNTPPRYTLELLSGQGVP